MKPSLSGMDSAAAIKRRQHLIPDGRTPKRFPLIGSLAVVFAALLLLPIAPRLTQLASADTQPGDTPDIPKSPATTNLVKKDIAQPGGMNPRGEALLYEAASTAIQPLGITMWAATLSPDGKTIATAQGQPQSKGEVRIWDRETGKVKKTIPFEKGVRSVIFSPDGKVLVTSCFDGAVRFHDPTTFAVWAIGDETSGGHKTTGVNGICFFKGGKYLASAGFDNTVRVWDVTAIMAARRTGDSIHVPPVAIFEGHTQRVLSVAGSEDGRTLLSGSIDKSARAWDVPDPLPKMGEKPAIITKERVLLGGHNNGVEGIAVSPDGQLLVTSAWGGLVLVRDRNGTKTELSVQMPGGVMCATFSRDGKYLAVGCGVQVNPRAKEVRVWEVATKKEVAIRSDFEEGVKGLEFTPDGKMLVVAVGTQTVHMWPWDEPKDKQTFTPPSLGFTPQPLLAAAVSPDGSLLAFSGETPSVFVYHRTQSKLVAELTGHEDVVGGLAFSPDGKTLATASYDKSIKLWNTESWKERRSLTGHTGWVFGVAFSPDGQTLASGSYDKTVRLWNVKTGEPKATWSEHGAGIRSVAFSPDGKKLISGGSDRILRVWDVAEGKVLLSLKGHKSAVRSVAFSPDGKSVASGAEDRTVKLWNVESGKETNTFTDLPDMVTVVRFSPKGQTLAAATFQGPIVLLDPLTNRKRQTLNAHNESVSAIVFTDDEQNIISVSQDRTIRQWSIVKTTIATPAQTLVGKFGITSTVAIAPNGTAAVLGNTDGSIAVWKLKTDSLHPYPGNHPGGIAHVAISDEMRIASVGKDNAILVGSLTSKETWKGKGSFAAFTPDGKYLAIATGKNIVLHDSVTGKPVDRFLGGHDGNVVRLAFSPDGTRMISGGDDTKMRLWNVTTGEKLQETPAFGLYATIVHLTFSPDGTRFAAAAYGPDQPPPDDMTGMFRVIREIRVFNVPKSEAEFANPVTFTPQPADQPITGLHWVSNGQALVSTAYDGTVRTAELAPNGAPERQRFRAHDASILASAISHEGGVFITIGEDLAVRRWRLPGVEPTSGQVRLISPGLTRVWSMLPSPDSKYIVAAGEGDKTFRVYAGLPSIIPVEPDNHPAVMSLAFSPDNRFLVTGHDKGILVVRDAATGKPLRTLTGLSKRVSSVAFAQDGAALVAVGGNWANGKEPGEAVVWDFPAGKIRHKLDAPSLQWMVAIHPDGKTAAVAGSDGKVRVWDLATGKLATTFGKEGAGLKVVAFDSTGSRIAAGGFDRVIRVWDTASGKELRTFPTAPLLPSKVLFSSSGKEIVISAWRGSDGPPDRQPTITAYSLDNPSAEPRQFAAPSASVMNLAFLPDGKTLIASGGEKGGQGSLRIYDFATARYLGQFSGHRHWGQAVAVSPDGKLLASTGWGQPTSGELRLWDPRGFRPIAEVKVPGENQYVSSGAIGPDGKLLILGGWGQTLTAWDMTDPTKPVLRKQLKEHKAGLRSVAFDAAGKRFVSTDESGMVKVWDATSLDLIVSFKASANAIYRAKFTPDGTQIVTVSGNWQARVKGEMRVWDPKTGVEIGRFPDQQREVWDIVFLNGGKQMAAIHTLTGAPDDANIKIWDFAKKVVVRNLLPPGSFTNGRCLGISPDGKHLAVGSSSGPVKVFETASWQEVLNIPDLTNCTFQLDFAHNGNNLLVASGEGAAIAVRLPK